MIAFFSCIFIFNCQNPTIKKQFICYQVAFENGDLIYRFGNGFFSSTFRDFSNKEKLYSHVGIIYKPSSIDTFFVIHSEASELTGIGGVRMETVKSFLCEANNWALYRIKADKEQKYNITKIANKFLQLKVPFDLDFNLEDTTAFYCTELVANCVNKSMHKVLIKAKTKKGNRDFIAIDDTYLGSAEKL